MDTLQLTQLCEFAKSFMGVYPIDKLPTTIPTPCSMIVNTKPSDHEGEHWVAIYFNKENYADYFCSYGIEPAPDFIRFMRKHSKAWNYTTKRLQSNVATTCGQYCVFFLFCREKGIPMQKCLSLFSKDLVNNDVLVTDFVNSKFNANTKLLDINLFIE